jgi:hypothetical protein
VMSHYLPAAMGIALIERKKLNRDRMQFFVQTASFRLGQGYFVVGRIRKSQARRRDATHRSPYHQ